MSASCWSCGGGPLTGLFSFQELPVSSLILVDSLDEALNYPRVGLELVLCERCGFAFNASFRPEDVDYTLPYESSQVFSPRFRAFADELIEHLVFAYGPKEILEIGSGDGSFLNELCRRAEAKGLAIDPTFDPTRISEDVEIRGLSRFYDETTTDLTGDLICCRHTLEHIQPVAEFVALVRRSALRRDGSVVFFEIPDTERIFREGAFWDVYNEHCSYFTIPSLAHLFRSQGFEVLRLSKGFDDQYLLIEAKPGDFTVEPDAGAVAEIVQLAERFRANANNEVEFWRALIDEEERPVVLWGASSKAVAFLSAIERDHNIAAAVDINPFKQDKYLPGSGVRVVSPDELAEINPGLVIIMNPIYVDEIRSSLVELGLDPDVHALGAEISLGTSE